MNYKLKFRYYDRNSKMFWIKHVVIYSTSLEEAKQEVSDKYHININNIYEE